LSRIIPATVVTLLSIFAFTLTFFALAPGVSNMFDAFDQTVEDQGLSSLSTHWNFIGTIMEYSFWTAAVIIIVALLIGLYMYASRVEYYTAGGYR
jgi:ABC-type spermidine/putrescine transport system permease subunit I